MRHLWAQVLKRLFRQRPLLLRPTALQPRRLPLIFIRDPVTVLPLWRKLFVPRLTRDILTFTWELGKFHASATGEIDPTEWPVTDRDTFFSWLGEILSEEDIQKFEETLDFDGATQYDFARVRINIFDSLHGPAMVLRLIPLKILTLEQLNLPPVFKDICHYHKGLILVTGPTGSGKSTTMAAMIDYINKEMPKHIITIEDPIEFIHVSKKALIKHREVGIHT